jgi:hypothetical protein
MVFAEVVTIKEFYTDFTLMATWILLYRIIIKPW